MQRRWLALVASTIVGFVLAGSALPASHSVARSSATPAWVTTAKQRLSKLDRKAPTSMTGYSRERFGPAWSDVDLERSAMADVLAGC